MVVVLIRSGGGDGDGSGETEVETHCQGGAWEYESWWLKREKEGNMGRGNRAGIGGEMISGSEVT